MVEWRKSRRSDAQGDACVEVARVGGAVAVRDSKDPDGPRLMITSAALRDVLDALTSGSPGFQSE
ncbi:DUF397 domain-containing protein [Actinomadura fibrosa]|uniref:DUF397 domain-containing protein n=1 Tax=Actinomadura fibrosa TaxID=111802 RepID=A0ABW2Y1R5_9ACTN|nr:DUF397 domain-containing protein [Actinomadura fibrosa]